MSLEDALTAANGITVTGEGDGTYLKQKLVPFGEYVPLQDLLRGLIAFFDLPMSDFARGPADQPLLQAKGYQIAPFICYEVVYPEFAAGLSALDNVIVGALHRERSVAAARPSSRRAPAAGSAAR